MAFLMCAMSLKANYYRMNESLLLIMHYKFCIMH